MPEGSHLVVCENFDYALTRVIQACLPSPVRLFPKEQGGDATVEDAHELIEEAYLSSDELKTVVLISPFYKTEVQNALLKILEEPPSNIRFIVIGKSKSAFLPTVRSRLPLFSLPVKKPPPEVDINLSKLDVKSVYDFLKRVEKLHKEEAKELLGAMFFEYAKTERATASVSISELELFSSSFVLLHLNTRPQTVFANLLLKLLSRSFK